MYVSPHEVLRQDLIKGVQTFDRLGIRAVMPHLNRFALWNRNIGEPTRPAANWSIPVTDAVALVRPTRTSNALIVISSATQHAMRTAFPFTLRWQRKVIGTATGLQSLVARDRP